jgi:hypothetical protein
MLPPQEAIDKVSLLLNPYLTLNTARQIDPRNRITLHQVGSFWQLSIHAEWFNIYEDYQWQIANAIYELIKKGVIIFPNYLATLLFIYSNPYSFILRIVAIEFYSNFRLEHVAISEGAIENGSVERYQDYNTGEYGSVYTGDRNRKKGRKPIGITYNKCKKDLETKRVSHQEWVKNPFKQRIEFRLYCNNTDWLNWFNLRGNYFDIFKRHLWYLATVYNNWIYSYSDINASENPMFKKIMRKASTIRTPKGECRYRGKKLKKMETIPEELSKPERITDKQKTQFKENTLKHFCSFSKNTEYQV